MRLHRLAGGDGVDDLVDVRGHLRRRHLANRNPCFRLTTGL
jgi:hypothetical protein